MQCAVIEFARNMCGLDEANSTEINADTKHPVIGLLEEQVKVTKKGGTMRLGAYPCVIKKGTKALQAYGTDSITERHRHRYEFNNSFKQVISKQGMIVTGTSPERDLVEIVEIKDHPWFVACQFHPEFQSTPLNAHPLFSRLVKAAMGNQEQRR